MVIRKPHGFTLMELLVVLAIVALLLTISVPRYFHSIDHSKEIILSENLRVTRATIDKFFADKGRYPNSLEELVTQHYLHTVPYDPILESSEAWVIVSPPDQAQGQVYDLHSGAPGDTQEGRPYAGL
jgi:general secretion pathway protein G